MPKPVSHIVPTKQLATSADLRAIIGEMDDATMLAILELGPTVDEVEQASLLANGQLERQVHADKRPEGTIARIFDILTEGDEDEPSSVR